MNEFLTQRKKLDFKKRKKKLHKFKPRIRSKESAFNLVSYNTEFDLKIDTKFKVNFY